MKTSDPESIELVRQAPDTVRLINKDPAAKLPYDTGRAGIALTGVLLSLLCGVVLTVCGVVIFVVNPDNGHFLTTPWHALRDPESTRPTRPPIQPEILTLFLVGVVTACTEATGYVHGTALKWALAKRGCLNFNANLRLLSRSASAWGINGWLSNAMFSILLVISYTAVNVSFATYPYVTLPATGTDGWDSSEFSEYRSGLFSIPLLIVGNAISIQSILALLAFYSTHIPTWSSSPLDVTSALVHMGSVQPRPGRCMRSVAANPRFYPFFEDGPILPFLSQPSPWVSHPRVQPLVLTTWGLVVTTLIWGGGTSVICSCRGWDGGTSASISFDWSSRNQIMGICIIGAVQAVFSLCLHCCELIVTLLRDELVWRAASSRKGAKPGGNTFVTAISWWQSGFLLFAKSILHWLFGRAISQQNRWSEVNDQGQVYDDGIQRQMRIMMSPSMVRSTRFIWMLSRFMLRTPLQTGILAAGLVPLAIFVTIIAKYEPQGPQPAAYGHIQTLADLVDEWSPRVYWGHKSTGEIECHAGALVTVHAFLALDSLLMDATTIRYKAIYTSPRSNA